MKDSYTLANFHKKYKKVELEFLGKGTKHYAFNLITQEDLLNGCLADPAGKEGVSKFTAYSQRFAQMFGFTMEREKYRTMQCFIGMWIQEFAMNTMKHKSKEEVSDEKRNDIAEVFFRTPGFEVENVDKWVNELADEAVKIFRNYERDYGVSEQSEEFIREFFWKVRAMMAEERSVAVTAISRDRDVQAVAKESLRGAGFYPNPNASMMEYLCVAILAS